MNARFLIRRFAHAALLLTAISLCSFALVQSAPGDFFDQMRMNPRVSAQTVEGLRSEYGLDHSFTVRYGMWLRSAVRGEFGISLAYNTPVGPLLIPRAQNTLLLTATSTFIAWILAIPIGVWRATNRKKLSRRSSELATSTLLTIPDLLLFLCVLLFAVRSGWFPSGGMFSVDSESHGLRRLKDIAWHLVLPALALALATLPALIRHVRSAMIEVLDSPFIRAARSHGIPNSRVLFRFALPVAANPLSSLFGFSVATMLSSSLLLEVILSWPGLGAFGHGTMVAGVIHLAAPTAQILPLKAFHPDGTGNLSDILSAIYFAVQNNASVINMSFDLSSTSTELNNAINYAAGKNVILVASSGNDGQQEIVYPAAMRGVMGVASTSNQDQRSSFSNYGNQIVWVAAPGEGVITTYPFGTYAAGWGTSFSSPFVAGTASLILDMQPKDNPTTASWALARAKWVGPNMGNGRLDVYGALSFLNPIQGLLQ
jgi:peptide/nickel transport system permease protein